MAFVRLGLCSSGYPGIHYVDQGVLIARGGGLGPETLPCLGPSVTADLLPGYLQP